MGPEIPYPSPCEQIDRHLWKHYLLATTVADSKNLNMSAPCKCSITFNLLWKWAGFISDAMKHIHSTNYKENHKLILIFWDFCYLLVPVNENAALIKLHFKSQMNLMKAYSTDVLFFKLVKKGWIQQLSEGTGQTTKRTWVSNLTFSNTWISCSRQVRTNSPSLTITSSKLFLVFFPLFLIESHCGHRSIMAFRIPVLVFGRLTPLW